MKLSIRDGIVRGDGVRNKRAATWREHEECMACRVTGLLKSLRTFGFPISFISILHWDSFFLFSFQRLSISIFSIVFLFFRGRIVVKKELYIT